MSVLTDFFQKNSTILIPLITTLIPISLTLKNFFRQKWWEKKENKYSELIYKLQEISDELMNIYETSYDDCRFDTEKLNKLNKLTKEFSLLTMKASPYFFIPCLEKISAINAKIQKIKREIYEISECEMANPRKISELHNNRLKLLYELEMHIRKEIKFVVFYMKTDLNIYFFSFIIKFLLYLNLFPKYAKKILQFHQSKQS